MTKVQVRFRLEKPLDERMMKGIADAHSLYGMMLVHVSPALDELIVDYDASRLKPEDVAGALKRGGIAIIQGQ
jgi:hypothetical protein